MPVMILSLLLLVLRFNLIDGTGKLLRLIKGKIIFKNFLFQIDISLIVQDLQTSSTSILRNSLGCLLFKAVHETDFTDMPFWAET